MEGMENMKEIESIEMQFIKKRDQKEHPFYHYEIKTKSNEKGKKG